ncbi:hypothetical protein [Aliivibrio wodanis]|uniref:hypothetical protein n=1 Tax=Aliivibrio wodanis TaxID=80852 RepID=UPI00406D0789
MKLNVDFSELENAVQQMKNTTIDCSKSNNTVDSLQYYKPLQCEQADIEAVLNQVNLMGYTNIDYLLSRFFTGSLYREKGMQIIVYLLATKQLICHEPSPLNEFSKVWAGKNES